MHKRRPLLLARLAQDTFDQGLQREARAVERHLARAWSGERKHLDLARL